VSNGEVLGDSEIQPALTPVRNTTRRNVVLDAIRRALLTGELVPGQRVKEGPLAAALGVSRPTIRDAIAQLVHEGSLVQEPYKGISVAQPSPQDLLEVADVRVSLETMAALHLNKDPNGEGMQRLHDALEMHLKAIEARDAVRIDLTHLEFHRTLWEGSGNHMLLRIWPLVEHHIRVAMAHDQAARDDPERDAEMHKRLVRVIAAGTQEEVAAEVRDHIAGSAAEIVKRMGTNGQAGRKEPWGDVNR
jgi:DNA-binding GntR family transcriptional regulator